jgi:hypothetical protein
VRPFRLAQRFERGVCLRSRVAALVRAMAHEQVRADRLAGGARCSNVTHERGVDRVPIRAACDHELHRWVLVVQQRRGLVAGHVDPG